MLEIFGLDDNKSNKINNNARNRNATDCISSNILYLWYYALFQKITNTYI